MSYSPKLPTSITNLEELRSWTDDELQAISQEFTNPDFLSMAVRYRDLTKPREGMLMYADGVSFNPGQGEGPYVYINGAWKPLSIYDLFTALQSAVTTLQAKFATGSWTPTLRFGGGNTGMTFSTQTGSYQVLDTLVIAQFDLRLSAKGSSTGPARLGGLPFTVAGASGGGFTHFTQGLTGLTGPMGYNFNTATGGTDLEIEQSTAGGVGALTDVHFTNSSFFIGTVIYTK